MRTADAPRRANQESPPAVLLAASNWWPSSARLAIALVKYGCVVSAICPPGHPLRYVRGIKTICVYHGLRSRSSLLAAIRHARPELVVPCDDCCVSQLHELHRLYPELRPLIERSLGDPSAFDVLESRDRLLLTARELGIRVPNGCAVTSAAHARDCYSRYGPSAVLKLDGTHGGEGVQIVRTENDAAAAFRRMSTTLGIGTAIKRLIVNRDPLVLWVWRRRRKPAVIMQEFISGTPANIMVACWQGEILGQVSVQAVLCQGPMGAANVVRVIDNHEISRAAALLAERLAMSGFFGLDFILERDSGTAYLIEMNPRCTQLGHLQMPRGDLAGALYARLRGEQRPEADLPIESDTIAFFPHAWLWGTKSGYLQSVYHDVPWEEKRLVELLMREPWPERQWPARIYHFFRRPSPTEVVEFAPTPHSPFAEKPRTAQERI
jgi:hypothetical protein